MIVIVCFIILQILFDITIVLGIRWINEHNYKWLLNHKDAINYLLEGEVNHKEAIEKIIDYITK